MESARQPKAGAINQSFSQSVGTGVVFLEPVGFSRVSGLDLSFRLKVIISDFLPRPCKLRGAAECAEWLLQVEGAGRVAWGPLCPV